VKAVITVTGITSVVYWLQNSTRDDPPADRAIFFRRFVVLSVIAVAINLTWHFFRAWLPLFLRTRHGYSLEDVSTFSMAYYLSTDAGSLTAGFTSLLLARRLLGVHASRVIVFAGCAGLTTLSIAVPQLATGPLLTITLLVVGFGALGLYPNYYSFTQELTIQHQGKVNGSLGCICWLSMSLLHEVVGNVVKSNVAAVGAAVGVPTILFDTGGSYTWVMSFAGIVPLLGLLTLLLFWGPASPGPVPVVEPAKTRGPRTGELVPETSS
jgi:MFS transporter, ACS family, hexuronate transporter